MKLKFSLCWMLKYAFFKYFMQGKVSARGWLISLFGTTWHKIYVICPPKFMGVWLTFIQCQNFLNLVYKGQMHFNRCLTVENVLYKPIFKFFFVNYQTTIIMLHSLISDFQPHCFVEFNLKFNHLEILPDCIYLTKQSLYLFIKTTNGWLIYFNVFCL